MFCLCGVFWCWFGFYALVYRFAGVGFRLVLVVLWMVLQYALLVTLGFACGGWVWWFPGFLVVVVLVTEFVG